MPFLFLNDSWAVDSCKHQFMEGFGREGCKTKKKMFRQENEASIFNIQATMKI